MRFAKSIAAWTVSLFLLVLAPLSLAEQVFVLSDGSRAVIVERQLVVTGKNGRRAVARPGIYETRDGRYTIVVDGKGAVIQPRTSPIR